MSVRKIKRWIACGTVVLAGILWFVSQFDGSGSLSSVDDVAPTIDTAETAVQTAPIDGDSATLVRVVDGDTLVALVAGEEEKIRMIGINSPESVDPRKKVECFGKEASAHLALLLANQSIVLVADETQGDTDKYDRLLRYVMLEDGTDVNAMMISDGYAYEYTYDDPYDRRTEYRALEKAAKTASAGLWSIETCNGKK